MKRLLREVNMPAEDEMNINERRKYVRLMKP